MSLDNFSQFFNDIAGGAIKFLVALLILLVFFIVARIVSGSIRKLLGKTDLDNRFAKTIGISSNISLENTLASVAFALVMIFGLIAFFKQLQLDAVTVPLQNLLDQVFGYLPKLGSALILLLLAWVLASIVKMVVIRGTSAMNLDRRLAQFDQEGAPKTPIGESLGAALFWLVFLFFLPGILDKLGMESLVTPLQDMLGRFMNFLPNLLGAAIILLIGMFLARILRQIITSLLTALGIDSFGKRAGLNISISNVIGTLVYTVVVLLTIVQALDALGIQSISGPATKMIDLLFSAVPNLIGAGLVLAISYFIGKLVAGLVTSLLGGIGFDNIPSRLGLNLNLERTLSEFVGWIIIGGIMLFATMAATDLLGFAQLTNVVETFVGFAGNVLMGIIVLGIGVWLANLAYNFAKSAGISQFMASIIRAAVLVLVGSMALQAIGIGQNIVELAFGIALGAIGIAAALAFGLGSREIAGREMERFITSVREDDKQ